MYLLHIIGKVGAKKAQFVEKYLVEYPRFNMKEFYQTTGLEPANLIANPSLYRDYLQQLSRAVEEFLNQCEEIHSEVALFASSGANRALNHILAQKKIYVIWIELQANAEHWEEIYQKRPYAEKLNELLDSIYQSNQTLYDNVFFWHTKRFQYQLPHYLDFLELATKKLDASERVLSFLRRDYSPRTEDYTKADQFFKAGRYICPNCGAGFSKRKFLQKHLDRNNVLLNESI